MGNELRHMGFSDVRGENGRVLFRGREEDIAAANIRSRFAERILLEVGRFRADTFDGLFEGVRALEWERFIPKNGAFPVKGWSLESGLHSVPDCQAVIKKAVSVRLGEKYGLAWLPEDGPLYQIRFSLMNDEAALYLDTSGVGLHKRGYRPAQVQAPLRETLAAALVDMAGYRGRGDFADPFCGSGTVAIEAALAAKGRAPGLGRSFAAEAWPNFSVPWEETRRQARAREFDRPYSILACDIDPKAVEIARQNAKRAGVEKLLRFEVCDAGKFRRGTEGGVIVTNPPYGERLLDLREARRIVGEFGRAMRDLPGWQVNIISSDQELERVYGRRARKVRKLYNGMIRCGYFMFGGGTPHGA